MGTVLHLLHELALRPFYSEYFNIHTFIIPPEKKQNRSNFSNNPSNTRTVRNKTLLLLPGEKGERGG